MNTILLSMAYLFLPKFIRNTYILVKFKRETAILNNETKCIKGKMICKRVNLFLQKGKIALRKGEIASQKGKSFSYLLRRLSVELELELRRLRRTGDFERESRRLDAAERDASFDPG